MHSALSDITTDFNNYFICSYIEILFSFQIHVPWKRMQLPEAQTISQLNRSLEWRK